jgi:CopG antitoxin of type II toxin-antitoxin system
MCIRRYGPAARLRSYVSEQSTSRIPAFASLEDEREFWDTHDLSDYWDEFKPITSAPAATIHHVIEVEISAPALGELIALARARGVAPLTLAAQWLEERLAAERADASQAR